MSMVDQLSIVKMEEEEEVKPEIVIKQEDLMFEKCRYCSDVRERCEMVLVPIDQTTSMRWIEKLGPAFSNNLKISSTNYICWRHFNLPIVLRSSYLKFLPKPMDCSDRSVMESTSNPEPSVIVVKQEESTVSRQCLYCDDALQIEKMVLVPQEKKLLAPWVKIFGPTFFYKLKTSSINYICWSHFSLPDTMKPRYLEFLPIKSVSDKNPIPRVKDLKRNEPKIRTRRMSPYMIIQKYKNSGNGQSTDRDIGPQQCVYCGSVRSPAEMSLVPDDPSNLIRLMGELGLKFFDKLTLSSTNYICWDHFNNPNNQYLPIEVENAQKMMNIKDESDKVEHICRHCGVKCKKLLLKWAEILGEQFLENVNTSNKTCWSHFKYRDPTRRSADNLPMTNEMMKKEEAERNVVETWNKVKVEAIGIEEKTNIETLREIVKKEEPDDQKLVAFSVPAYTCYTNTSLEEETKPLLIIKNE